MALLSAVPDVSGLSLREAAVAYARAGFFVGVTVRGKNPGWLLGRGWPDKTSSDPSTVDGWFIGQGRETWNPGRANENPTALFIHCGRSGLIVFDVDTPDAVPEDLRAIFDATRPARQDTRSDGSRHHLVYSTEESFGNSLGSLPKGWGDVRGKNGIVIVEPSPHSSGDSAYRWIRHAIPPLPATLAERLRGTRAAEEFDVVRAGLGTPIPLGQRDDTILRYACRLRGRGLDRDEAMALLRLRAADCDNTDGRVTEVFLRAKLDNAWKYSAGMAADLAVSATEPDPRSEEAFWSARPVLGHLRAAARARRTAPWAVLTLTLARVVCAVPPAVTLPPTVGSRASLNTFVALVGPSGSGKSAARSVSRDALRIADEAETTPLGSGEGISACYVQFVPKSGKGADAVPAHHEQFNDRAFFEAEEIGTLGAIKGRGGSTLGDTLRRAWDGRTLGFAYRAAEKRLIVPEHAYRLCLWVGVQPDAADVLMDDSGVGTPQRFVWARVTDAERPDDPGEMPEPWEWSLPELPVDDELFSDDPEWRYDIPLCASAVTAIHAARDAALLGEEGLNAHVLLCRTKIAAALAVLDGRWRVEEEDWDLSGAVIAHSNAVRDGLVAHLRRALLRETEAKGHARATQEVIVAERLESVAVGKVAQRIVRLLADGPLTRQELNRRMAGRDKPYLADALSHLGDRIESVSDVGVRGHEVVSWMLRR